MLRFLLPLLLLGPVLLGANEAPAAPASLAQYRTADALWDHMSELRKQPETKPASQEEFNTLAAAWYGQQQEAAEVFLQRFPKDPRAYAARITATQCRVQLGRLRNASPEEMAVETRKLQEIIAAPETPEVGKGEASFIYTTILGDDLDENKPENARPFLVASADFLTHYGSHYLAPQMRKLQLNVAMNSELPEALDILERIASEPSPLSMLARGNLAQRKATKDLLGRPVELSFTAVDGTKVDLAQMRGKVVLVDFWASWCTICLVEAPNIAATFAGFREKGFEVVGICLDEDKAAMEAAIKKYELSWPHAFDGQGWNSPLARKYNINQLPASWLVDKKGLIRFTNLRGEALGTKVQTLLAE